MAISASSGLASGIDYESLIKQLVSIKRQSVKDLNKNKSTFEGTKSAYDKLRTAVDAFSTAAEELKTAKGFGHFNTSVSNSTLFDATSTSNAAYGSFEVRVDAIAKSHKLAADGVATSTDIVAAGAGSFSFQVGTGAAQTVSVDATTTITSLKDSINNLGVGVTASVVNDGDPTNPYRLIISSDTTGTANAITITQNNTTLVFSTTLQAAQDASVNVDGLTYTRPTNNISDIVTGVTLDLKSANPAITATLAVSRDTEKIMEGLQALVDGYNSVVKLIKSKNRYDSDNKVAGEFFGDSVARSIWEDLRRAMTGAIGALPGDMNRLLHVGITTDSAGVMKIDETKLSDMLNTRFNDVVALFKEEPAGVKGFGGLLYDLAYSINDIVDGRIKSKQDGLGRGIRRIDKDILTKEAEVVRYEEGLRAQFMGLETLIAGLQSQSSFLLNL
ncbi:MAG: flagellar filament capping protein FliD [Thermodesulfobacteriota bacterium]|nr:MAG: flagellar filament capping protein FliD [Thermodesulfobacteriota bacterium]